MKLVNIADEGAKYKWQLYDLYDKAFPEQEKKPLQVMENLVADGKMEMLAMVDEDEFVGLAINLIDAEQDRALLDYYAIVPEKRNYGYGSRGLEALLKKFKNHKYIFEIETQDEKAENAEERKKRKAFYLRNGLQETGLFVNVYDTDFEILTPDGELTFWEYVDFLREVMYEEYVQILRPTLIAMKIIKIQKEIEDRERGRKCGFSLSGSMFFCISGRICGFDCRRRRTDLTSGIYDCGTAGTYCDCNK